MSIVVNADDFGFSQSVNEAIAESFEKGLINRTTLMTNMPYAREAMELAKQRGFADKVGIHVNLTAGKPLSDAMAKDLTMCSSQGEFTADFARNLKTRFFLKGSTSRNIEQELRTQFDTYAELGGELWHVDSHHHVHTDPSVWKVMRMVIKEYPVTSVRIGRNMYRGGNVLMRIYKIILNSDIRKSCARACDFFGSGLDYNEYTLGMDTDNKQKFVKNNNIEIMVHPMYGSNGELTDSGEKFDKYLDLW